MDIFGKISENHPHHEINYTGVNDITPMFLLLTLSRLFRWECVQPLKKNLKREWSSINFNVLLSPFIGVMIDESSSLSFWNKSIWWQNTIISLVALIQFDIDKIFHIVHVRPGKNCFVSLLKKLYDFSKSCNKFKFFSLEVSVISC